MGLRYTEFPNLYSSTPERTEGDPISTSISLNPEHHPYLVIAWAILLRCYTEENSPIFRVHGDNVLVDTSDFTSPVEPVPDGFDLLLRSEEWSGFISLVCSPRVPPNQIQHIIDQLIFIIQYRAKPRQFGLSWKTFGSSKLSIVNRHPLKADGVELLHELVAKPENNSLTALEFRASNGQLRNFSYTELHDQSAQFAKHIGLFLGQEISKNGPKQVIVPVLIPQCPELYLTILAILKAGAAFCPLHLDAPSERIEFISEDVVASVIITTSDLKYKFRWKNPPVILLADEILEGYNRNRKPNEDIPKPTCNPNDLAYVMYTSGSTGLPKAVGISHLAVTQSLLAHDRHIPKFRRFLQFAAPTFDVFVFEMFFPLFRGETLVGCDRSELLSDLPSMINCLDIDAAELTPTVVGSLVQKRSIVPCLRMLLTIGEMLTRPIIEEFGDSPFGKGILHGMYGPTEAAIHCTLAMKFSSRFKVGIIGMPLDTVSCFIIAPYAPEEGMLQEVEALPVGHIGELAIGGIQLADGYLHRLEQTSLAFVETKLHGRVYRTGDKARLLPDGMLECLGRLNTGQIKLRGQRIELGEIEQIAYRNRGIVSATAVVISGIVVLFCVVRDVSITSDDLLDLCRRWLPGFAVPGDVVLLMDVPRLPSGKVDKFQIENDYKKSRIASTSECHDILTDTEKHVSKIIQQLLGLNVDICTNLATMGLDSLKAIRLASLLRSAGISIGAVDILKLNTIQAIAESSCTSKDLGHLQDRQAASGEWDSVQRDVRSELQMLISVSEYDDVEDIIPCTPLQIAMLAETKLDPTSYCNWIEFELSNSIKSEDIEIAFLRLSNQNEILRTGFVQTQNKSYPFVQVIWKCISKSQFSEVLSLDNDFRMDTSFEFLRPLRVQIQSSGARINILLQIHHALYDGWSGEHIISDLDLILRNQNVVARPQFRELVSYYQQSSEVEKQASKEYWHSVLQEASSCKLPNLHGRTGTDLGFRAATFTMSTQLPEVESAAQKLAVSPQSIFQAVFAWLLAIYIGSSDVIFGIVSSGRTLPVAGIEDIIGPCIATLPVRLDLDHSRTVQDLVQTAHRLSRQMLDHHELPLRDIKKSCGIEPGNLLFDSILIWQQSLEKQKPENLTQTNAKDRLEFNLSLEVEPYEDMIYLKANYQCGILPSAQVDIFLLQIDQLVAAFIRNPCTPLADINCHLTQEILSLENSSPEKCLIEPSLSEHVEMFAQKHPFRIALEFVRSINGNVVEVESVSYSNLNRRANQIANYLVEQHVSADELVSICMEKSVDLYISILGIIKAGAGYLPITPETPMKRRNEILMESKVKICLCQSSLLEQVGYSSDRTEKSDPQKDVLSSARASKNDLIRNNISQPQPTLNFICVDQIDLDSMPTSSPITEYPPSHLAYVIFTSGTTGAPKGVQVTHGNICSNLSALSRIYPVQDDSRLLQSCSQAFDVSVFEIFFAWFTGICLCAATQNVLFWDFENAINAMRITHLSLTPTVAALVEPMNVPSVEFLVTAGEALTEKVFNSWKGKGLFQGYGPSETTNICTVKKSVSTFDSIRNLGPPLPNTSAFAMQTSGSLALIPRGGVGEFCFGGDQVFRGYLDMPLLNAQKIIDHPQFGRLYRSGDFGRILWDGSLEYCGRQDDQVKIRGQRVELGEINNLLLSMPETLDVITLIVEAESASQRLLTFWVPKGCACTEWHVLSDQEVLKQTLDALFSNLSSSLPSYMIPSLIIPISYLPMTTQGKIDKRRLIKASSNLSRNYMEHFSQPFDHGDDDQEWTPTEQKISKTLCAIINCEREDVRRRTSFLSLGLDSVSAVSFSKSLRDQGFFKADVPMILRHPTVSLLGKILESISEGRGSESLLSEPEINFDHAEEARLLEKYQKLGKSISKILPCTPLQEAMLSSFGSGASNAYYNHTIFDIHGDIRRLFDAWKQTVSKYDILRTSFATTEVGSHSFAQVVQTSNDLDWTTITVSDKNLSDALNQRMLQVTSNVNEQNPPYSFTVFKVSIKTILLLSMHHALYDGEAIQLLLKEVQDVYDGLITPPAVSFEPFLKLMLSLDLNEADMFWNAHLKGFKPKAFPRLSLDNTGPQRRNGCLEAFITQLPFSTSLRALEKTCKRLSLSLLGLAQASWAKLLSLYLGTRDICFGNIVSGRTLPLEGVERLIAPCFNTLPLRLQIDSAISNLDLIRRAQQGNLDALPYQFSPLRRINKSYDTDIRRLFDSLFILQKPQNSPNNHIWSINSDIGLMDFPIVCEILPIKDRDMLQFNLHSHVGMVSNEASLIILKTLDAIMNACLRYPAALAADFEFLDAHLIQIARAAHMTTETGEEETTVSSSQEPHTEQRSEAAEQWSPSENEILHIVAKLAKHQPNTIGLQTTFFRLGLDSINAVQIAAQLRQRGQRVSPIEVLEYPTIGKLATYLQSKRQNQHVEIKQLGFESFDENSRRDICVRHTVRDIDLEIIRPCTAIQSGMLASFLHSQGFLYFNAIAIQLPGKENLEKLQIAWSNVVNKYEMLRTGFTNVDNSKYPFAMMTYKKGVFDSTLSVLQDESLESAETLAERTRAISRIILNTLQSPPWRIEIIRQKTKDLLFRLYIHHALFDAVSLRIIFEDFESSYCGIALDPAVPINLLLESILFESDADMENKKMFWKSYMKDVPITKFPNTTVLQIQSKRANSVQKPCEMSLHEVKEKCQSIGVTVQLACQAAWARVLSSYTGELSVRFGLVLSGRNDFEGAGTIAFPSIVTVPVCTRVDGTNRELLEQLMGTYPSLLKHQFTPLPKIQRWTSQTDEPLFDSIVVYQDSSGYATKSKTSWKILEEEASIDYPISVEFVPSDYPEDILEIHIITKEDIIPREQASILLDQLEVALLDSIRYPDNRSNGTSSFHKKLLSITPAKEICIPSDTFLLHQFPEKVAIDSPEKIALEFVTSIDVNKVVKHQWTYRDLDEEGNKIAQYLIHKGIGPRNMIAICFNKCPEASFAILGILKAGCSFVAIDPAAPADRQKFIVQDSKSCLVLAMENTAVALREDTKSLVISLDDFLQSFWTYGLPEKSPIISPKLQADDLCYCLYTSGTSGTPKACLLTHENAVQAMLSFQRLFRGRWDENSRFLQFASFHFDVSILEQYWSWSVGICVTSAPRDLIFEDMGGFIRALNITHLDLTPSLAKTLHPDEVPSLCNGVFINGGEKLAQDILDLWGSKECIYNGYGPTETTIGNTMFPRVPSNGRPSNIGRQFDNVGTYVLQPGTDSLVLRGAVGELCIAGKLVGPGYLNQPDLTRKKFPYLRDYGERVYRTGDLVRILYDDSFDFIGRADDQVKLRGQRLEVGEINEVIKRGIDKVRDVTTLVLEHMKSQRMQLVSFFVLTAPKKRETVLEILRGDVSQKIASTIRQICQAKLPPYMIPSHFIPINNIPLSSNNKIETRQLKSLYNNLSSADLENLDRAQREPETVWTAIESRIVDLLSKATGFEISLIKKDSSIFRIGLDSISVVNFTRSLKDSGFPNAQVSTVMQNPIVSQLSEALASPPQNHDFQSFTQLLAQKSIEAFRCRHLYAVCKALSFAIEKIDAIAPCTPLQEGIISRSLGSDTSIYFEEFNFELSPMADMQKLKHAWNQVTASTQILRTQFCPTTDGYAQVVLKDFHLPWYEKDFSSQGELDNFRNHQYHTWWTTNRELLGSLFEVSILQSWDQRLMCLRIFHALYDGHSILQIFQNLKLEYGHASGVNYGSPYHKVLAYGPLREVDGAKDFWRSRLEALTYESFQNLPATPSQGISSIILEIPRLPMNEARRHYCTTHQSLVQAAWVKVLQKYFPSQLIFGMVISGRSIDFEDVDRVIGPLFNTIPVHIDIKGCTSWSEVISRCHDFNTAVLPYQHSSLRDIMKWCQRSQESPLFETLFVFQKEITDHSMNAQGLWTQIETDPKADVSQLHLLRETANGLKYPLSFEAQLSQDEETLRLTIVAHNGMSTKENSAKMLNDLGIALSEIMTGSGIFEPNASIQTHDAAYASQETIKLNTGNEVKVTTVSNPFAWSPDACIIRDVIACLADCETSTINAQSSIFSLGLDSIDVVKLSTRLKQQFIDISVSMIMRNPSIELMVSEICKNSKIVKDSTNKIDLALFWEQLSSHLLSSGIDIEDTEDLLPPTPLQEAIVADMLSNKSLRYFNQEVFLLDRSTNVDKLMLAWKLVIEQSPILRTSFIPIDDPDIPISFAQVVHRPGTPRVRSVEAGLKEAHVIIEDAKETEKLTVVDGAFFMLTFIHGKDDTHLILSVSHALYDGWSLALLHNDVLKAYQDDYSPRPSYRSTLEHILSANGDEASQYWSNYISGAECSSFPSRVDNHQTPPQIYRLEQSSSISGASVRSFVKREGITLQALGQTCWALVLASYLNSFDVIFGVVLSGRDTEESSQVLFPTMNTIVVRSIIHGSASQMLRDMQDSCIYATQFQHFPLRKVQAVAENKGKRLFDSLFILQRKPSSSQDSKQLYESIGGDSSVEFPVCVEMELDTDYLNWRIACENSIFDEDDSKNLMNRIESVFREILESPEKPMIELTGDSAVVCGLPPFRVNHIKDEDIDIFVDIPDASDEEWTNTESLIRSILSDVSHIPEKDISRQQTIFNLGLDSISAIKVSSLLRKRSLNLGVGEMLRAATVLQMARVADQKAPSGFTETLDSDSVLVKQQNILPIREILLGAGIDMGNVQKTLPCSSGQVYMLSRWQNSEGVLFYPTFCYQTSEHLDKVRLIKAWETLRETTPILRTTFASTDDRAVPFIQVIFKQSLSPITWLANPPSDGLLKPTLPHPPVSLGVLIPQVSSMNTNLKTTLFLTIHHALYDGVSLTTLIQRLQDLYENPRLAIESKLSFEDFLAYGLTASSQETGNEFWSNYLGTSHHRLLPLTDLKLRTSVDQRNSHFRSSLISSIEKISTQARLSNISLQALFFAAYARVHATLLSRIALSNLQPSDVVFGIYLANRSLPLQGLPTMVAPTLSLVPLLVRAALTTPILESAKIIQQDLYAISSPQNSRVGLWEIKDLAGVETDCFVNILSLPTPFDDELQTKTPRWEEVSPEWNQAFPANPNPNLEAGIPSTTGKFLGFKSNPVSDAYRESLDIEIAVRNGGLDVGIFYPKCLKGSEHVEWMMEELKLALETL